MTEDGTPANASSSAPRGHLPIVICAATIVLLDIVATVLNLDGGKVFAGADSGFLTYYPLKVLRLALSPWNFNNGFGYPDFLSSQALPYAVLSSALAAFHLPYEDVGRLYFFVALALLGLGTFALAFSALSALRGSRPSSSVAVRAFCALFAALAASFNPFTCYLFDYPISPFQFGVVVWPGICAYAVYLLGSRKPLFHAPLFALVLSAATFANPAHVLLGFVAVFAIFIAFVGKLGKDAIRIAAVTSVLVVGCTAHIWLPAIATATVLHGETIIREALKFDATAIAADQARESVRSSLSALLRFDGVSSWSIQAASTWYDSNRLAVCGGFIPAAFAIVALARRSRMVAAVWCALLAGLLFSKNMHPPFPLYAPWLFQHVPGYAAFREAYDKFILVVLLTLPLLAAIGLETLLMRPVRIRYGALVVAGVGLFAGLPFISGHAADRAFQVTIPAEYVQVSRLLGNNDDERALTLPGNYLDGYSTTWYRGSSFESFLYQTQVVNGVIFRQRGISSAPLYNDDALEFVKELPTLVKILPNYAIRYIVLHKDTPTEHSMSSRDARLNGPLFVRGAELVLGRDAGLDRIFNGRLLAVYRLRRPVHRAFLTPIVNPLFGYEDSLLPLAENGLAPAPGHSAYLVVGNGPRSEFSQIDRLSRSREFLAIAPATGEPPGLYQEQQSVTPNELLSALRKAPNAPSIYLAMPKRGNYLTGFVNAPSNFSTNIDVRSHQTSRLQLVASSGTVPEERLHAFFGAPPGVQGPTPAAVRLGNGVSVGLTQLNLSGPHFPLPSIRRVDFANSSTYFARFNLSTQPEYAQLNLKVAPTSLGLQPKFTLRYDPPAAPEQCAVRFELVGRSGASHFDEPLDASGFLSAFDIRYALQTQLPSGQQADDYRLTGIAVIMTRASGSILNDASGEIAFGLRYAILNVSDPGSPGFRTAAFRGSFTSAGFPRVSSTYSDASAHDTNGTRVVSAKLLVPPFAQRSPQIGDLVRVKTRQGTLVRGALLMRDQSMLVLTQDDSIVTALPMRDVQMMEIISERIVGMYRALIPVPQVAVQSAPYLALRFSLGDQGERMTIGLDLTVLHRHIVVPVVLGNAAGYKNALFGASVSDEDDQGFRTLDLDLRRVANEAANANSATLSGVSVAIESGGTGAPPGTYTRSFALGPLALLRDEQGEGWKSASEHAGVFLDGQRLSPKSALLRGSLIEMNFGNVALTAGHHAVSTELSEPLQAESLTFGAPQQRAANAVQRALDTTRIAESLYWMRGDLKSDESLLFADTYHPGWRLFAVTRRPANRWDWLLGLRWLSKPESEKSHFMANAFSNAWALRKGANQSFVLDFVPQDLTYVGIAVSLFCAISGLILAFVLRGRSGNAQT